MILPGATTGTLGTCPAALLDLVPADPYVAEKRFMALLSRANALKGRTDLPIVIDLENMGYGVPGATLKRPTMVKAQ